VKYKLKEEFGGSTRLKSKSAYKLNRALRNSEEQKKAEKRRQKFMEDHSNEISVIQNLWDDLGVSESFRNIFLNISFELDITNCKDFLNYEINSLLKLAGNLQVKYKI